ncbi:FAD-binding oxidoreductase [Conexibacter sp. CPCC 206217]|uniref:FAD-binding oxidoreductase n=1 Tax=Conexibacter sp. CPCC 206217 TaxID=3064574 RepID=UPI00271CD9C2|nr:FAD-binding oxidoreductase [Conexibacter sp. CPCC 206217]MDO8212077.1 FAD-binding oxidoreductase [Conexibacter sp. CPCC 206217]
MSGLLVLERGESGYEDARRDAVWNARMPDRRPEAIAIARDERDVVAAVALARERDWRIGIRSGGHNFVGASVRDGGLLLDVSRLNAVTVDAATRSATAQPGVKGEQLLARLRAEGLAFGVGHCPSVALGGFALGGGMGFNTGAWGYGSQQVTAVDVVLADGRQVRADAHSEPDLFWAARGGGPGFFGVVTRFHLALQRDPEGLMSSSYAFPLELLEDVAAWLDEITPQLDPCVEPMGWIGRLRGHEIGSAATPAGHGRDGAGGDDRVLLLNALVFGATPELSRAALEPLEQGALNERALARTVVDTTFPELFEFQNLLYRQGLRYAVDCIWTDTPPREQPLGFVREQMRAAPSGRTHALWQLPFGNHRAPMPDMAAGVLGRYFVSFYAVWEHERDDERNIGWLRETMDGLESISTGHYAGDVDLLAAPSRAAATLSPAHWTRLQGLRARYDPDGRFHPHLQPA